MSFRMLRVYPQADGDTFRLLPQWPEALQLIEGVEYEMIGNAKEFNNVALFECGRKAVYLTPELFPSELCFPG